MERRRFSEKELVARFRVRLVSGKIYFLGRPKKKYMTVDRLSQSRAVHRAYPWSAESMKLWNPINGKRQPVLAYATAAIFRT
jgi:hypothetical protein